MGSVILEVPYFCLDYSGRRAKFELVGAARSGNFCVYLVAMMGEIAVGGNFSGCCDRNLGYPAGVGNFSG
jgi:hypothetical protein